MDIPSLERRGVDIPLKPSIRPWQETPAGYRYSAAVTDNGNQATPDTGSRLAISPAVGCKRFSAASRW